MKRTAGLIAIFSFTLFVTLAFLSNKLVLAKEIGLRRVTSSYINRIGEQHQYYRFNQNTTFKYGGRKVTLPKGTIVNGEVVLGSTKKVLMSGWVGVSYALKKKLNLKEPTKEFGVYLSYSPKKYTLIKRPAYTLPYGNNILYSGGVSTFKDRAVKYYHDSSFPSNALRVTSDGYLEFYKYGHTPLSDGGLEWSYVQKPTSYVKVNYVLNKGSKKYLYFQRKLSGVKATRLSGGRYRYRLTINNLHTPYKYTGKSYDMVASFYTVGGVKYFEAPAQSNNYGSD
ncbi:hypothetical protein [Lentilactobacillus hilgardii]|uniref:hypothetical protein n=1 Tax=Lentilactobacillus hilgardii TaxID=1588 RepID=UPI003FA54D65